MSEQTARVVASDYHRNGVGGAGFTVSIIDDFEHGRMLMIDFSHAYGTDEFAEVGQEYGYTAVLNLDEAAKGNIFMHPEEGIPGSGGNAWRGDRLGDQYRPLVRAHQKAAWERFLAKLETAQEEGNR